MTPVLGEQFDAVVEAARAGSQEAIARLYRTLHPALLRYLTARAGQAGEDIAGQVWLEVARRLAAFRGDEAAFRRWVFSLGHRRLTDHLRAGGRRREDAVPDDRLVLVADHRDLAADVVAELSGRRAAARVAELLPPELAEVVLLRVVAGLTADEVAAIVGRPAGTVRVQQHRALRRLAEKLSAPGGEL